MRAAELTPLMGLTGRKRQRPRTGENEDEKEHTCIRNARPSELREKNSRCSLNTVFLCSFVCLFSLSGVSRFFFLTFLEKALLGKGSYFC